MATPVSYSLGHELPEMKADSLHQPGDFALLLCQNAMQAMNVGELCSLSRHS
jgi:hypothetical protein